MLPAPHIDIQKSLLKIYQCLQYHRMITLSVVMSQGLLRGGNDGNGRAISCTNALRKPHLDENPLTILRRPCLVGMLTHVLQNYLQWLSLHHALLYSPSNFLLEWLILLYSTLVPNLQRQMMTLFKRQWHLKSITSFEMKLQILTQNCKVSSSFRLKILLPFPLTPIPSDFVPKWMAPVPHADSSLLQTCGR